MDSKGNIYEDPSAEQVKEKKLVAGDESVKHLTRAQRRELYRKKIKLQAKLARLERGSNETGN